MADLIRSTIRTDLRSEDVGTEAVAIAELKVGMRTTPWSIPWILIVGEYCRDTTLANRVPTRAGDTHHTAVAAWMSENEREKH